MIVLFFLAAAVFVATLAGVAGVIESRERPRVRRLPVPATVPPVDMFGDLRLSEIQAEWAIKRQERELRDLGVVVSPFELSASTREWLKAQREKKQGAQRRSHRSHRSLERMEPLIQAHATFGVSAADAAEGFRQLAEAMYPLPPLWAQDQIMRDQAELLREQAEWSRRIAEDQLRLAQGLSPGPDAPLSADAVVDEAQRILRGDDERQG